MAAAAGHIQVEQNRAPAVLPRVDELARAAADQPRGHREHHRRTPTRIGLTVNAELDTGDYPMGIKSSDQEIQNLEKQNVLRRHDFHCEWNYCLDPPLPPPETNILFICGH